MFPCGYHTENTDRFYDQIWESESKMEVKKELKKAETQISLAILGS